MGGHVMYSYVYMWPDLQKGVLYMRYVTQLVFDPQLWNLVAQSIMLFLPLLCYAAAHIQLIYIMLKIMLENK